MIIAWAGTNGRRKCYNDDLGYLILIGARYIWFLCGFGYLLDLLWAQAFGLILGPLEQELGFQGSESGNISVAFSAGLTAGAFCWGVLVDIIGRKWAFNLTCLISAAFGISLGGCDTYTAFLVITAFVGFGIGGNIPIDTTICLEFIPQDRRFMLALLSIFQPVGVVVTSAIAYGFIPNYSCSPNFSEQNKLASCNNVPEGTPCCTRESNMGWRYLMFTLGAITFTVFFARFLLFNFKESPKFLVARGRDQEAIDTLQHIAKVNQRECGVALADFEAIDAEFKTVDDALVDRTWKAMAWAEMARYKELFKDASMIRLTVLIWLTYAFDFWGFTRKFHNIVKRRVIWLTVSQWRERISPISSPSKILASTSLSDRHTGATSPYTPLGSSGSSWAP